MVWEGDECLELRQYKNNSNQFEQIPRPQTSNSRIAHILFQCTGDLELRQYKNNSDQFEQIPRLNLPHFFNHRMSHAWANQHVFLECKQK